MFIPIWGPGNADFQHWWGSENGSAASMQVARNTGVGRGILISYHLKYLCNHSKHLETIYWILLIYIHISITFNRIQSGMIQAYPTIQPKITLQMLRNLMDFSWPHGPMTPWPHGPISQGAKIEQCLKLQASFGDPEVPEVSNPEQCLNFARG